MEDYQEAMLKSLVAVAWADGRVDGSESEVLDALLDAFGVHGGEAESIRTYAKEPRAIEDVPLSDLSYGDRTMLLQHAVVLTYIDGEQTDKEREVIGTLVQKLNLPDAVSAQLIHDSETRAQRLVALL